MSSHVTLGLHFPEETVTCDFQSALVCFPTGARENPLTDYFSTTGRLVQKIINTTYADDAEVLGLLVLGVISSAEFYFRTILTELSAICPLCVEHSELVNIPSGALAFYTQSGFPPTMSALEHESFADSKTIIVQIKRFSGLSCSDSTSVKKALDDFELLCELRHCFVHARGFAGLKAMRALGGSRVLHKVLVKQQQALDFIKLSHNAVRAVNHFLSHEILNRWINGDVLSGRWRTDRKLFTRYWDLFAKAGEDSFSGQPRKAYAPVRRVILKRLQGMAARVAT